jgi:hypothetical protein
MGQTPVAAIIFKPFRHADKRHGRLPMSEASPSSVAAEAKMRSPRIMALA